MTATQEQLMHKSASTIDIYHERNKVLIDACKKQGGFGEIGQGYVVVDTKKFKVEER